MQVHSRWKREMENMRHKHDSEKCATLVVMIYARTHARTRLSLAEANVVVDKSQQSVDVFVKMLDVVVSGTVDPQRLDRAWTPLVDGTAVGEIDHFIVLAVDHEDRRRYPLHLVNTAHQQQTVFEPRQPNTWAEPRQPNTWGEPRQPNTSAEPRQHGQKRQYRTPMGRRPQVFDPDKWHATAEWASFAPHRLVQPYNK